MHLCMPNPINHPTMRLRKLMEIVMIVLLIITVIAMKERRKMEDPSLIKASLLPKNSPNLQNAND